MKMIIGVVVCVTVGLFSAAGPSQARASSDDDAQIRPCNGFCCEENPNGDCRVCIHAGQQCP